MTDKNLNGFEVLTRNFFFEWSGKYESSESDEREYSALLSKVQENIRDSGTLTKQVFIEILSWKSNRLKGIVRLAEFENEYLTVLSQAINERDSKIKFNLILGLYGIHTPTASAILHFINPAIFPVIDFRTIETLYYFKLLKSKSKSEKNYWNFFEIVHCLSEKSKSTLREIDKALFAFHKTELNKTKFLE